jgi:hypothetical protein
MRPSPSGNRIGQSQHLFGYRVSVVALEKADVLRQE